ncbi:unnamed protein product [Paramecium sonneborni]|uniref:Uncharacterized protein n=1 Tax=Paramecium sonneborni TaxID=65129 RepID=A0A8S1PKI9_9CILI|nr:unnamed protein product [Paramecium sonneborni]
MNKMKLKLTQSTKDLNSKSDRSNQRNQSQEIEQMMSSPEVKKFEAFLFESITSKQRLSMKFSQFTPIPQKVNDIYEDQFTWNHNLDHRNSDL